MKVRIVVSPQLSVPFGSYVYFSRILCNAGLRRIEDLKLRADVQFFSQAKEKYPWSIFINDSEGLKTILLIDVVNCYKEIGWQLARRMDLPVSQRFMIFNQGDVNSSAKCNYFVNLG